MKDLSSEDTRDRKGDEESPGVSTVTSMSVPTPIYQTSTGQYSKLYKIWGHIVTKLASKYRLFVCYIFESKVKLKKFGYLSSKVITLTACNQTGV